MTMTSERLRGIIIIVVCVIIIILLIIMISINKDIRDVDDNFCPKDNYWQNYFNIKAGKESVILIDTSNAIPTKDGQAASIWVEKWIRKFPPFQKISIHHLWQTEKHSLEFVKGPWCVSWNKGTAPAFVTGGLVAERDFTNKFLTTIQTDFDKAINLPEAKQSPIMEKLAALKAEGINSVFLVSDMLQYTDTEKHYGNTPLCDSNCPDIKGMSLNVYYIKRENVDRPANHRQRWEDLVGKEITWHSFETKREGRK